MGYPDIRAYARQSTFQRKSWPERRLDRRRGSAGTNDRALWALPSGFSKSRKIYHAIFHERRYCIHIGSSFHVDCDSNTLQVTCCILETNSTCLLSRMQSSSRLTHPLSMSTFRCACLFSEACFSTDRSIEKVPRQLRSTHGSSINK
jgi:hypothetical protein